MTAPVWWRAATEADFDELLAVLNASERYDREPEITPPDELAEHLASTDIVLDGDSVVGVVGGRIVAFGFCHRRSNPGPEFDFVNLYSGVEPAARDLIGDGLIAQLTRRGIDLLADAPPGRVHALSAGLVERNTTEVLRLERAGFQPERYFTEMSMSIHGAVDHVDHVEGVAITGWREELSEAVRTTHNAAFADHWGSSPLDTQEWREIFTDSVHFRPDLSSVAVRGDEVVGYVLVRHRHKHPPQPHLIDFASIGVARSARGKGIATALIRRSMGHVWSDSTLTDVELSADSASSSRAYTLYERLGFRPLYRTVTMLRRL